MKKFATPVFWLSMLACGGGSGAAISILDDVELHEVAIASTDGYLLFTSVLLAAIGSCAFIYNNASRSISFSGLSDKPFMVLGVSRDDKSISYMIREHNGERLVGDTYLLYVPSGKLLLECKPGTIYTKKKPKMGGRDALATRPRHGKWNMTAG